MDEEIKKPNCTTEKGRLTNGAGFEAEEVVKKKLWSFGYSVKHDSYCKHYDLLVDDKFKVEVKTSRIRYTKTGKASWNIMLPLHTCDYDVLAVVLPQFLGQPQIYYFRKDTVLAYFGKHKYFGWDKYGLTITPGTKHGDEVLSKAITSPYDVFGKPEKQK